MDYPFNILTGPSDCTNPEILDRSEWQDHYSRNTLTGPKWGYYPFNTVIRPMIWLSLTYLDRWEWLDYPWHTLTGGSAWTIPDIPWQVEVTGLSLTYLDRCEWLEDGVPLAPLLGHYPIRLPVSQVDTYRTIRSSKYGQAEREVVCVAH